jgi:exopolysaccharide biosynthesis polyprenyl glycosylphosphotransferase
MLKAKARMISGFIFLLDLGITLAGFVAAYLLRDTLLPLLFPASLPLGLYPLGQYAGPMLWVAFSWAVLLQNFRIYRSHRTYTLLQEVGQVAKVVLVGGGAFLAVLFLFRWTFVSRPFVLLFLTINFISLAAVKLGIRLAARWTRRKGFNYRNLLIVGNGTRALEMAEMFRGNPHWGFHILGFVSDGHQTDAPVLGEIEDVPRLLQERVVDDVIVVVSRKKLEELEPLFALCQELGINTRAALNIFPRVHSRLHLETVQGVPLLTFTRIPTNVFDLAVKRAFDVLFAVLALVLLSPLLAAIALAVGAGSRGPVLFRQTRCGLNGRRFTMFKFRSMRADAEDRRDEVAHLNQMDGPAFKAPDDPRITPVGRLLRKFSLDELPQFWNVLRGEMSVVGPRPPVPEEVEKYQRWQRRRLSMRPGLTCLWQISGRSKLDFDTWMKLDLEYIDTWSLKLDLWIILKTVPAVLSGRGAH